MWAGWGSGVRAGVMAVHDASFVCVRGNVAGTTCIHYVEINRSRFCITADYVSVHGSFLLH